jgi:sugar O-acyltransferase (sialic acid O-acetyltransferase NeuD family)
MQYSDIAIIDRPEKVGQSVFGITIVGSDEHIPELFERGYRQAIVTVGSVGAPQTRVELFRLLKSNGFTLPAVIDKTAVLSQNDTLVGEGVFIGKGAIINTGVNLGECCIINSGAIIDHDSKIGRFVHVGPGVSISGDAIIGDYSHIGTGSAVLQSIRIGANTIIGAGSVVTRDMPEGVIAFGNPCKERRKVGSTL